MVQALLRGMRTWGSAVASVAGRTDGCGCGIHFDAGGLQLVRLARVAGPERLRLITSGTLAFDDDVMRGAVVHKPEAVARAVVDLLDRVGLQASDLRDDTVVMALPSGQLRTETIDVPRTLPPRAVQAWCERRAALLLPGGGPSPRARVGVAWAEPGSQRLRLYACEGAIVDDRTAALELAGMRVDAVDASHAASRRAFKWSQMAVPCAVSASDAEPHLPALLHVGEQDIDIAVFDAGKCVSDVRERFDVTSVHVDIAADVVRGVLANLSVRPVVLYVAAGTLPPAATLALCDAVAAATTVPVRPFDPVAGFCDGRASGRQRYTLMQRTTMTVACGLALRAMNLRGLSWE